MYFSLHSFVLLFQEIDASFDFLEQVVLELSLKLHHLSVFRQDLNLVFMAQQQGSLAWIASLRAASATNKKTC